MENAMTFANRFSAAAVLVALGIAVALAHQAVAKPDKKGDEPARVWRSAHIATYRGHTGRVQQVGLSRDGRFAASVAYKPGAGRNIELKLWNAETGEEIAELPCAERSVRSLSFSGDCRLLVVCGDFGRAMTLWDVQTQMVIKEFDRHRHGRAVLDAHGSRVLAFDHQAFTLLDVKTGNVLASSTGQLPFSDQGVSPDFKWLACANVQEIDLWDIDAGKQAKILGEHRGNVKRIAFSRDGRTLVSASVVNSGDYVWIGQVKLWDIAAGKERSTLAAKTHLVLGLDLSPDEKTLALLDYPEIDGKTELMLVDVATGKESRFTGLADRLETPRFLTDDRVVLIGLDKEKLVHLFAVSR
jgi:WD40 repeat protein